MNRGEKDLQNELYFIMAEVRALSYEKDSAEMYLQKVRRQLMQIEDKIDELNKRMIKIGEQMNQMKN